MKVPAMLVGSGQRWILVDVIAVLLTWPVSVMAVLVDTRSRLGAFLVDIPVSLGWETFIECRTLPKVGNWVLVTVDNDPSFRSCCRVALVCNLGDWFLILGGWWTEDSSHWCTLTCTQSVGALIPSAFVSAKCVASFFPFCLGLFFFCVCVHRFPH